MKSLETTIPVISALVSLTALAIVPLILQRCVDELSLQIADSSQPRVFRPRIASGTAWLSAIGGMIMNRQQLSSIVPINMSSSRAHSAIRDGSSSDNARLTRHHAH